MEKISKNTMSFALICLVLITIGALGPSVIALYLQREDSAYLWDWGWYFSVYQNFGNLVRHGNSWGLALFNTVRNDDYNYLPVVALVPFSLVFHDSRFGYLVSIFICYLIPISIIMAVSVRCLLEKKINPYYKSINSFVLLVVFFLLYHPFWNPTLRGLPDVVALIPLGCATLIMFRSNFLTDASWRLAGVMGFICWLTFALRRWYAYSIVAVLTISIVIAMVYLYNSKSTKEKIFRVILNYIICFFVSVILLMAFQYNLLLRIINTSYSEAYIGYQKPFYMSMCIFYWTFGPVYIVLFFIGSIVAFFTRNYKIIFCFSSSILTFFLFTRTQAPSIQHLLPIAYWIAIVCGYYVWAIADISSSKWNRAPGIVLVLYSMIASASVFFPAGERGLYVLRDILPIQKIHPLRVNNIDDYRRMIANIKDLTAAKEKVSVFASSEVLADSLLEALDSSLSGVLVTASQVDARDFMYLPPLRSRYAVVTEKPVTHLTEGTQQVIVLPDQDILKGIGLGTSYEKVAGPFLLSDGNHAFIFQRIRPLSDEDIESLQVQLNKSYPKWKWDRGDMIR